jgi:hypothetical protein
VDELSFFFLHIHVSFYFLIFSRWSRCLLHLREQDSNNLTKTLKNKVILAYMPGWAKL